MPVLASSNSTKLDSDGGINGANGGNEFACVREGPGRSAHLGQHPRCDAVHGKCDPVGIRRASEYPIRVPTMSGEYDRETESFGVLQERDDVWMHGRLT